MQCRDERREYNFSSKMRFVPCFMTSALLEVYWTVPIYSLTQCSSGLLDALSACPPQIHWIDVDRSLPLRLLFISHLCSWRPLCLESACLHCLQGMCFSCPQMLPTGSILSYSLFVPIFVLSSSIYFELCQFSDFHCGHLKTIQDGDQIPCRL